MKARCLAEGGAWDAHFRAVSDPAEIAATHHTTTVSKATQGIQTARPEMVSGLHFVKVGTYMGSRKSRAKYRIN